MARDYKNRVRSAAPSKKKTRSGPSPALMLVFGLLIGVVVGLIAGLGVVTTRTYVELREDLARRMAGVPAPSEQASAAVDGSNGPRWEFFTILPEMEVVVDEDEAQRITSTPPPKPKPAASKPASKPSSSATAATTSKPQPTASKDRYLLQVASFKSVREADRLKAELALMGLEAGIQTVEIKGGQTWHRVRIGPFSDNSEINTVRQRLQDKGLQAVLLKVSSG